MTRLRALAIPLALMAFVAAGPATAQEVDFSLDETMTVQETEIAYRLDLALRARGRTSPNPLVGAVVGVGFARGPVKAPADDLLVAGDDAAHGRVGIGGEATLLGQAQGFAGGVKVAM